jgi:hypothetical protein
MYDYLYVDDYNDSDDDDDYDDDDGDDDDDVGVDFWNHVWVPL